MWEQLATKALVQIFLLYRGELLADYIFLGENQDHFASRVPAKLVLENWWHMQEGTSSIEKNEQHFKSLANSPQMATYLYLALEKR